MSGKTLTIGAPDSGAPTLDHAPPGSGYATPKATKSGWAAQIDRYLAPLLITAILLTAQFKYGVLESPYHTLLAILTSMAVEMLLGRTITGKWPHLASAYITGISVGILIRSPQLWPYALCAAIAIVSKYAIRLRGRHLWNPSNLAVSAMLFLYPSYVAPLMQQWGNNTAAIIVIWILGTIIIGRLKRFHITLTYVVGFVCFAVVRAHFNHQPLKAELAPMTSAPYQLFIFFMITDPKTTVRNRIGQACTAFMVAVAEWVLRIHQVIDAPYYALFIVGPMAKLIEIVWTSRLKTAPKRPAAA